MSSDRPIRRAGRDDFPFISDVLTRVWPETPIGVDLLEHDETTLAEEYRPLFWRAGDAGVAQAYRDPGAYDPRRWTLKVSVLPTSRRLGIGGRLCDEAMGFLTGQGAREIWTNVAEGDLGSQRFALTRGFAEMKRDFFSEVSLSDRVFDGPRVPEKVDLASMASLDGSWEFGNVGFRRKLHEAFEEVRKDIPRETPPTPTTFEFYAQQVLGDPGFLWEHSFAIVEGEEVVGLSMCFASSEAGLVEQGLTAVRREWRRRGLARCLKLAVLRSAQDAGFRAVRADNDSRNAAMLALNRELGFEKMAGWVTMRRQIGQADLQ